MGLQGEGRSRAQKEKHARDGIEYRSEEDGVLSERGQNSWGILEERASGTTVQ